MTYFTPGSRWLACNLVTVTASLWAAGASAAGYVI